MAGEGAEALARQPAYRLQLDDAHQRGGLRLPRSCVASSGQPAVQRGDAQAELVGRAARVRRLFTDTAISAGHAIQELPERMAADLRRQGPSRTAARMIEHESARPRLSVFAPVRLAATRGDRRRPRPELSAGRLCGR